MGTSIFSLPVAALKFLPCDSAKKGKIRPSMYYQVLRFSGRPDRSPGAAASAAARGAVFSLLSILGPQ